MRASEGQDETEHGLAGVGRAGFGEECQEHGEEPIGGAGKKVGWEEQALGKNRALEKKELVGGAGMGREGFGEEQQNLEEDTIAGMGRRWDGKSRIWEGVSGHWRRARWWCREKVGWEQKDLGKSIKALERIALVAWGEGRMGRAGFGEECQEPGEEPVGGAGKR